MYIEKLELGNVRSFEPDTKVEFSNGINLLIGPNNTGKSTIIAALRLLQGEQGRFTAPRLKQSLRVGAKRAQVHYHFGDITEQFHHLFGTQPTQKRGGVRLEWDATQGATFRAANDRGELLGNPRPVAAMFPSEEPNNFFYYFLNQRRPPQYQGGVGRMAESAVRESYMFLPAKIDRLSSTGNPKALGFQRKMEDILGLKISASGGVSDNQKVAGTFTDDGDHFIEIDELGAGVSQVAALLCDLTMARGKIFLIEEPENDLHPEVLAKLLCEIKAAATSNQFIISTHSHTVVSTLGSEPNTKVFALRLQEKRPIPTSTIEPMGPSPAERTLLLKRLGYDVRDFGLLAAGYLLVEESAADYVIGNYFIPAYAPRLIGRLKTFSSDGASNLPARFEALQSLFQFLHPGPVAKSASWVRLNSGADAEKTLGELRSRHGQSAERFAAWKKARFEQYYPSHFEAQLRSVSQMTDWKAQMEAKADLARQVVVWGMSHPQQARQHFDAVAQDIIDTLRAIELALLR